MVSVAGASSRSGLSCVAFELSAHAFRAYADALGLTPPSAFTGLARAAKRMRVFSVREKLFVIVFAHSAPFVKVRHNDAGVHRVDANTFRREL